MFFRLYDVPWVCPLFSSFVKYFAVARDVCSFTQQQNKLSGLLSVSLCVSDSVSCENCFSCCCCLGEIFSFLKLKC